jgi:hypothetical protein
LNGFRFDAVGFVAVVAGDGLAVLVTEVCGHLGVEGVVEQGFRQLFEGPFLPRRSSGFWWVLRSWLTSLGLMVVGLVI